MPNENWDEDYIRLIKEMSDNSYGMCVREKLEEPFGFEMVYQFVLK